jgi:hypothetical protein
VLCAASTTNIIAGQHVGTDGCVDHVSVGLPRRQALVDDSCLRSTLAVARARIAAEATKQVMAPLYADAFTDGNCSREE